MQARAVIFPRLKLPSHTYYVLSHLCRLQKCLIDILLVPRFVKQFYIGIEQPFIGLAILGILGNLKKGPS